MPDEPTTEEMMRVIELYVPDYAGPTPYPWRVMKAAIRARIERKVSGKYIGERKDMAEYVRELYVGSHNPVENVPNKKGHYPCKFKWCAEKYDKLIKFILGHAALSGPSEEEREELVKWLADYAERYTGFMMSRPYMVIEPTEEDKKKWAEVKAIILGHAQEGEKK